MSTQKCAPCPARSTFGDHANAQRFDNRTRATPAAAAERSIEPTLPGSCTSSSNRQKPVGAGTPATGGATTARTPTPAGSVASSPKRAAGTIIVRSESRSANERTAGRESASSLTISVSGAPYRAAKTSTTCSPSSTHRPALRRSRDEATSRAASFSRGLLREVIRCTVRYVDRGRSRRAGRACDPDVSACRPTGRPDGSAGSMAPPASGRPPAVHRRAAAKPAEAGRRLRPA